jgi:hypothetical protein
MDIDILADGRAGSVRGGDSEPQRIGAEIEGPKIATLMKHGPTVAAIRNAIGFVGHARSSEVVE